MNIKDRQLHRIVSTAIIRKDGKYLILKRSNDRKVFPGKWTVPGGGLEVGDYINTEKTTDTTWYFVVEISLRREILEETGIEVDKIKYLCDMTFVRPDNVPVIVLSYYCDYKSNEVKLNGEHTEAVWATVDQAKNYDLIGGILEEIEMVEDIYNGKGPSETKIRNMSHK